MTSPKNESVSKARAQADSAIEGVRTPLLAALGAGNLASQAVLDALTNARTRVGEGPAGAKRTIEDARKAATDFRSQVDVAAVREKLDPAEVRKLVEDYTEAARKLYEKLAETGEEALGSILETSQLRKAIEQLQEAIETAQTRIEDATTDARERVDSVLTRVEGLPVVGKVAKRGKETTSKAASTAKKATGTAATKASSTAKKASTTAKKTASSSTAKKPSTTAKKTTSSTAAKKPSTPKTSSAARKTTTARASAAKKPATTRKSTTTPKSNN